jgi:hypothetical protein
VAERLQLRIGWWLLATICGALLFLEMRRHGVPAAYVVSTCVFRRMTGIPCPGCGLTRALYAMVRGEWKELFVLHPLAPFLAFEGVAIWAAWGAWAAGWPLPLKGERLERFAEKLVLFNAALFVLVWGVRLYFHAIP